MKLAAILSTTMTLAASLSCGSGDDESIMVCPATNLRPRLQAGSITFAIGGGTPETRPVLSEKQWELQGSDSSACVGYGPEKQVWTNYACPGAAVYVNCDIATGSFYVRTPLFEVGSLAVGRYDLVAATGSTPSSNFDPFEAPTKVHVTRAVGGLAPYPAAVTADYVREYTVHMESWAALSAEGLPVSTVDVQFAETAADAVNYPSALCD